MARLRLGRAPLIPVGKAPGHEVQGRQLDAEALATLAAASRNDGAATAGAHAHEEAVRPLAPTVVRLESSLHLTCSWVWPGPEGVAAGGLGA